LRRPVTAGLVKTTARRLMAEGGTAGLSLRAIARRLEVTAPAIYNYFHRLEDLITALVVDSYTSLAHAMEATESENAAGDVHDRLCALCATYRAWALAHPVEFELISGRPFPGYRASEEVCLPLGRRPFLGIFRCFVEAHRTGRLSIPEEYRTLPPGMVAGIAAWRRESGNEMPDGLLALLVSGWARIHGMVLLEMHGHTRPLLGDPAEFYRLEIEAFARWMNLKKAQ
jgi:AcrR family transcriptional regulator